jgi:hypothetical protein
LKAEDIVMTGTCVLSVLIAAGQHFVADFGTLGKFHALLTDEGKAPERIRYRCAAKIKKSLPEGARAL